MKRKTRRSSSRKGINFGLGSIKRAIDFSIKLPGLLILSEFLYEDVMALWYWFLSLLSL